MSLGTELKYRDFQERYRTLAKYKIEVPHSEQELAVKIESDWKSLFDEARRVDRNLIKVKKKFKQVHVYIHSVFACISCSLLHAQICNH